MIKIRSSEANKYVIIALQTLGVDVNKIILKEKDNNLKCFLFYNKKLNGINFEKVIQIENRNYLRLVSYGIKISSKGEKVNGVCLSRKNS